jgi:hypothetical protein
MAEFDIPNNGGIYRCTGVEGHSQFHHWIEEEYAAWDKEIYNMLKKTDFNVIGKAQQLIDEQPDKESILAEAERLVNGPRAESYGPPQKNFTDIAYGWSKILSLNTIGGITPAQVALCMIWLKMMRFQNGKPDRDSIVDIAGYAATIEKLFPDLV